MKLILMGGCLGSGKTTLILDMVALLKNQYENIVIVENEIGEIGVDGEYLELNGLSVQNIYSGCICCSLATDLVFTLNKIASELNPNLVIVEASGVAVLSNVIKGIRAVNFQLDIKTVAIIDAVRFKAFITVLRPLIVDQINCADALLINKADKVKEEEIKNIADSALEFQPDIPIFPVSRGCGNESFIEWIKHD